MATLKSPVKEIRFISPNGINFLIKEEGIILKPYRDSVGIPTIGIGCTYYENGLGIVTGKQIGRAHV